jgi:hypothetical protein
MSLWFSAVKELSKHALEWFDGGEVWGLDWVGVDGLDFDWGQVVLVVGHDKLVFSLGGFGHDGGFGRYDICFHGL